MPSEPLKRNLTQEIGDRLEKSMALVNGIKPIYTSGTYL